MIKKLKSAWNAYRLGKHIMDVSELLPSFVYRDGDRLLLSKEEFYDVEYLGTLHTIAYMKNKQSWTTLTKLIEDKK